MDLHALYSMPRLDEVAKLIESVYGVGVISHCALANRGFNDVYVVETASGERFVTRIANRRARPVSNLDYETAFLCHLASSGVSVATPVATREGRLWCTASLAEGDRAIVLFRYLNGRIAKRGSRLDAYAQGRTLGRVHLAGRSYTEPKSKIQLDAQHLIKDPLTAILELPTPEPDDRAFVSDFAARLLEQLEEAKRGLAWGCCHGDCHGYNARIIERDGGNPTASLFDFDDGGAGWLAYDLAVYLWNRALDSETMHLWPVFLRGYQSAHPLPPADLDATLLFVPIRHLWLLGEYASRTEEWGLDRLSALWFSRQVKFLRQWEDMHLAARLF